jgi:RimJ/RimL family protein N-acetyltransferase
LREAEIGYWLSPEHTRKGYASKAGTFLVQEIAHKDMDCDIVRAVSYVDNPRSRGVAERAGMVLEIEKVTMLIPKTGENRDLCCYVSHKDEATKDIIKTSFNY